MWLMGRSTFETVVDQNPDVTGWYADPPYAYLDPCPRYLVVNNAVAPFDNRDVRWAISHAHQPRSAGRYCLGRLDRRQ